MNHGTRATYNTGCRCNPCRQANGNYQRHYRHTAHIPAGSLLVACWCQQQADYLPADDIWNGTTWSCGQPHCTPPATPRTPPKP